MHNNTLFIFRRDLRLYDNTALIDACKYSRTVIPIFIFDDKQCKNNPYFSEKAFSFMLKSLQELLMELKKYNGNLYFFVGDTASVISQITNNLSIDAIFHNIDYTPFSRKRDAKIEKIAATNNINYQAYADLLLTEPMEAVKADGSPYVKFTPFANNARKILVHKPKKFNFTNFYQKNISFANKNILSKYIKEYTTNLIIKPGRKNGLQYLKDTQNLRDYANIRNIPHLNATSHLSAHNKFGTLSIREIYQQISEVLGKHHGLINELYWRDFFTHICFHFPYVLGKEFNNKYQKIKWQKNNKYFQAWCSGKTGFPIVDAGMQELNETGFMHNRLRMITASFLVKDLQIDWRLGEKYFASKLIDYDVAVNNGNWQWAASTGCDAQPYFRIFNPWLQQKKYDPACLYIKRWLPHLQSLSAEQIHNEHSVDRNQLHCKPIVEHTQAKQITLDLYKSL